MIVSFPESILGIDRV